MVKMTRDREALSERGRRPRLNLMNSREMGKRIITDNQVNANITMGTQSAKVRIKIKIMNKNDKNGGSNEVIYSHT